MKCICFILFPYFIIIYLSKSLYAKFTTLAWNFLVFIHTYIHSFINLLYSLRNSLLPGGLVLCHRQLQTVYIYRLFLQCSRREFSSQTVHTLRYFFNVRTYVHVVHTCIRTYIEIYPLLCMYIFYHITTGNTVHTVQSRTVQTTEYTECWPCPLFNILLNKYFPAGQPSDR